MLSKPIVPVSPVMLKDRLVVAEDWLVVNVTFDICEAVTFPFMDRAMDVPLLVAA